LRKRLQQRAAGVRRGGRRTGRALQQQTGAKNLCLAGGLFLESGGGRGTLKKIRGSICFVQPAAGNEGTSLGAALVCAPHMRAVLGRARMVKLDWGPVYSNQEIKNRFWKIVRRASGFHPNDDQQMEELWQLLGAGKIVGWFTRC